MRAILIVIPIYRAPELIEPQFFSLLERAVELAECKCRVLIINDSPDDFAVAETLRRELPSLQEKIDIIVEENEKNIGFIRSVNKGLSAAILEDRDVIVLNSDAFLTEGAVREMRDVAYLDPLISAVSPRSNNATICNSPYANRFRSANSTAAIAAHKELEPLLPRFTYSPTAVGFCLFVKRDVLIEFGAFDTIYGFGYNEENDFIMRCNRSGYRAVLANRAFVLHQGSVSFEQSGEGRSSREQRNRAILDGRYPEYGRAIERFFSSPQYRSQLLASSIIADEEGRHRILFDCNNVGAYHNGTFEHAKRLIAAFSEKYGAQYRITVACNADAMSFHDFQSFVDADFIIGDNQIELSDDDPFAFSVRLAQPFKLEHLVSVSSVAAISGFLMLDSIAMDCAHLDDVGLQRLWGQMLNTVSFVGYNSSFTRNQFSKRFVIPDRVHQFVSLCSTDVKDYSPKTVGHVDNKTDNGGAILVIGNKFAHKNLDETVKILRGISPRPQIIVFGADIPEKDGIVGYSSGGRDEEFVNDLFRSASVVLFPSYYEGFGLPIVESLARRKPVIARSIPVFEEIRERSASGSNVYLASTTREMVDLAIICPKWNDEVREVAINHDWTSAADQLHAGLQAALHNFNVNDLELRLQHVDDYANLIEQRAESENLRQRSQALRAVVVNGAARPTKSGRERQGIDNDWRRQGKFITGGRELVWEARQLISSVPELVLKGLEIPHRRSRRGARVRRVSRVTYPSRIRTEAADLIDATNFVDVFALRKAMYRLLVLAEKLEIQGVVRFNITRIHRPAMAGLFLETVDGLSALCANAGLLASINDKGTYFAVEAKKVRHWYDFVDTRWNPEKFIQMTYGAAFGRDVDHGARYWVEHVGTKLQHIEIARRLFSSSERVDILRDLL